MKITVIGAANSGTAAAVLAKHRGYEVFISEYNPKEKVKQENLELLETNQIESEFGGHTDRALDCEKIVVSPGVPRTAGIIKQAEEKSIKIVSEPEFACEGIKNPIIAVTGTNGKTTTTSLIEHIFKTAGKNVIACGNIGIPVSEAVEKVAEDTVLVVEISSFQLDRIFDFKPEVAVITNITPDHLSYHGSMDNYVETKWKIAKNQEADNLLILNADDDVLTQSKSDNLRGNPSVAYFSAGQVATGVGIDEDRIIFYKAQHKDEVLMTTQELALPGIHNAYNSMAAALAARYFEISDKAISESLRTFQAVEHRLEKVRTIGGVTFVNDSKATNVNSTWYALQSYDKPLIWIAGGRGDNNDYSLLDKHVQKHVTHIVTLGEESEAIFNHYCLLKPCLKADSLQAAVEKAFHSADNDSIVLFSPACKSFDMFDSYIKRGEAFKEIINNLK
jgi:UDP-N-acetylmuramoylalanine--D-glutamate ligase